MIKFPVQHFYYGGKQWKKYSKEEFFSVRAQTTGLTALT